jgi:flagellar assembly factor FliW
MSQDEVLVSFPQGLAGFPKMQEFRLFEPVGGYPLKFLQSTEDPDLSFTCMDAAAVKMDYEVPLDETVARTLSLENPDEALVLLLTIVPEDPSQTTANLAGPLVINTRTHVGVQVMLDSNQFPLHFPVFTSKEEVRISFPTGLVGFPQFHSFRLFEPEGGYPLKFLQSVDEPDISFSCIDVAAIRPDFQVPLGEEDSAVLALETPEDALVLALVVIPEDPRKMTANLAGPVVINTKTRMGRQVVLNTNAYPLKFPVLADR